MSPTLWLGTRKGLFKVQREGKRWDISEAHFLADNVSMLLRDSRDGALHVALDHGHFGAKVHVSRDGGATWQESGVPAYPPKPEEEEDKDMWGKPLEWKLRRVWALETGGADQPGRLWCGTLPGGLFRSDDSGATWQLIESLWRHPKRKEWFGGGADYPGIHSVCVDPRDSRNVHVGVSCGGVWYTPDDGENWEPRATGMWAAYMPPEKKDDPNIQDPHRVVRCPAAPDYLWAQHHNGVFRSKDAGLSWQEVTEVPPSVFGFAIVVHPRDPETAWLVPAIKDEKRIPVDGKFVVARTRDGGRSFDVLREGLPQKHAYDIVFRHGMDIDHTGQVLAVGSTTGSCWITEDQGDTWHCISQHLPPIYCVRFE